MDFEPSKQENHTKESVASNLNEWFNAAKSFVTSKVTQLQQEIQPDFEEFTDNIRTDAKTWIKANSSKLMNLSLLSGKNDEQMLSEKEKIANSNFGDIIAVKSSMLDENVNEYAKQETKSTTEDEKLKNKQPTFLTNASATLRTKYYQMRKLDSTYTEENWDTKIDEENFLAYKADSFEILDFTTDEVVMNMKKKLVPSVLSEEMFWKIFLYKISLLKKEEEFLSSLLLSVKNNDNRQVDEEDISWDDADTNVQAQ